MEQGQDLSADKGYDSEPNNRKLWQDHRVKPLIDIRSTWKEKETRLIDDTRANNIVYDEAGQIYCHCPLTEERREMAYQGFEADRESLKYRCPAGRLWIPMPGTQPVRHRPLQRVWAGGSDSLGEKSSDFYSHRSQQLRLEARLQKTHGGGTSQQPPGYQLPL